jgi:hypothetical protein
MRLRVVILAGLAALAASAARAAETTPKPQDDQAVTLSPVALPIVVDGHLVNYIFATVKVLLKPSADSIALREKEPYFRDALVRAAHRTPFVLPNDYNHVDERKLKAIMTREATVIAGANAIAGIALVEQTPQHQVRSPRPAAPAPH